MNLQEYLNENDRFAKYAGARLTEVREGYARAELTVEAHHLNGGNVCQGGVLFTLADLAFAGVSNSTGVLTFGIENTITFVHSAKEGDHLVAEGRVSYEHPKIPFCEMKIHNQEGTLICSMTGLGYRKHQEIPKI